MTNHKFTTQNIAKALREAKKDHPELQVVKMVSYSLGAEDLLVDCRDSVAAKWQIVVPKQCLEDMDKVDEIVQRVLIDIQSRQVLEDMPVLREEETKPLKRKATKKPKKLSLKDRMEAVKNKLKV